MLISGSTSRDKIVLWFYKRFGRLPEKDVAYFKEWEERFKSGDAWKHMDLESRKVWQELRDEQYPV